MKVTVVPAQITTVEDRIAGNLGLSQLLLLAAPVFGGSALYIILPPILHSAPYKLVVITLLLVVCALLAIRIKGKILLVWLSVVLRYNLRPMCYVTNKNSLAGREQSSASKLIEPEPEPVAQPLTQPLSSALTPADTVRALAVMENPDAQLSFETTKQGGLYVRITEVKESA